jgi:hypothetical protein
MRQDREDSRNAAFYRGNQAGEGYTLHYSASPVQGDDIPTEEECRQILLSMQNVMDREAPILSTTFNKQRNSGYSARSASLPTRPNLQIHIPKVQGLESPVLGIRNGEAFSISSSNSDTPRSETSKLTLWRRRKAAGPSRLGGRGGAANWTNGFDLKAKMSKLSLKGSSLIQKRRGSSSSSESVCILCRTGKPASRGFCQTCEDDFTIPQDVFTTDEDSASWLPPPPRLDHISLHCQPSSLSLPSQQSDNRSSSPVPRRQGVQAPPTPLSDMPTPLVESRLRGSGLLGSETEKDAERDLYDEPWAEYYFDEKNFLQPGDAASVADQFMRRRLELDDYEAVFASPIVLSPEESWI